MHAPYCPQCQQDFPGEDYCPVDGVRLTVRPALEATPESVPEPSREPLAMPVSADTQAAQLSGEPLTGEQSTGAREKLASLMKKFHLRAVDREAAAPDASGLPEELREMGWRIDGMVTSQAGVDRWPVVRGAADGAQHATFSIYRLGSLTSNPCYEFIQAASFPALPEVLAYGTLDLTGGARADYDLIATPPQVGQCLDAWFAATEAGEERAWHLLPSLATLLRRLQQIGVQAIVLEPSHLAWSDDGSLVLTQAGALAHAEQSSKVIRYRPEFARSPLLPQNWTAPEVMQQSVLSANAELFSAGQLLALSVFGQTFTLAEVMAGAIPFRAVADQRLSTLLMGCLYPRSADRWSIADFLAATSCDAREMPPVGPWASMVPGAASTAFSLAGQSFWRLEDLLDAAVMPRHWDEAVIRIEDLLQWARGTNWVGQAEMLLAALAAGRTADSVLLRLARIARPNAPCTWRGLDLSDEHAQDSLGALAQGALRRDASAIATMQALFAADLRGALTE